MIDGMRTRPVYPLRLRASADGYPPAMLRTFLVTFVALVGFAAPASAVEVGTLNLWEGKANPTGFAPVIGWQEAEVDAKEGTPAVMDKLRGIPGYTTWFPAGEQPKPFSANAVPISYKSDVFTAVARGKKLTHGGQKKVTPSRWVTWLVLQNTKTGNSFVFVNTHFISKAFTGEPKRRGRWNRHLGKLRSEVSRLKRKYKLPIVVVGDFNRPAYSGIPGLDPVAGQGTPTPYDQIYATKGVQAGPMTRLDSFGSDHFAWTATVKIKGD
jgi:hypothetical protein